MLNDITIGQYFPGRSLLHRLDPRTKLIGTLLFITAIFFAESYLAYSILALWTAALIVVSGVPVRLVLKSLKPLWIIIVLTLGIHIFTTPGNVIYQIGPLTATKEGLRQGLLMTARLVFLIAVSSLLTFTTSPIALTDGIERLLAPFKRFGLPAHELAMMMTIALRFIPTLLEETDRIMKAQMARGADFASGNILRRAQNMVPLLVPLFISAFRRADELATAMEARCYRGGQHRTRMKELRLAGRDYIALVSVAALLGILVVLRYY
ncbi:cobalt transport protein [Thermosinus carboxydivorans Nor1]|uniref:Energy-coupling factor transporter transmembrane protein EcfT n=1 Tax=Thermosinus carboxydivorans Nor1 TaxID=401526 RepID=A1HQP4_9FIRM|nr:energy-coupling factor transporter transmembrane component T [Thermosinus carboxydivorans]EAX47605.1 cobalt transport protein [Thermosinus carboxydivorans Nor1]